MWYQLTADTLVALLIALLVVVSVYVAISTWCMREEVESATIRAELAEQRELQLTHEILKLRKQINRIGISGAPKKGMK